VRVVHLESGIHLYGGALQALLLAEGLQARGWENLLCASRDSEVAREARNRGLPVREISLAGEGDLLFPFRFRRIIQEYRADLVHLHSRRGADTLGAMAARGAGKSVVISRRVDNPEPGWIVGPKYRLYDAVITISHAIREVLVQQGVPESKVHCVRSALDPTPFEAPCLREVFLKEMGLETDHLVVGMAAQFIPRKGHDLLLAAIPAIVERRPEARFVLLGRGPLRPEIEARVREKRLDDRVVFAGFRRDLPELIGCFDVLVHPAVREGLGVTLLQASAAGVPIVATRVGGIPEAVRDGVNGVLVDPSDAGALARAVADLLEDEEKAQRLGKGGRSLIRDEFSVDQMVEGNLAVYRTVLA
jgi:glycosyltransferase involved in cell wall biosynthesis